MQFWKTNFCMFLLQPLVLHQMWSWLGENDSVVNDNLYNIYKQQALHKHCKTFLVNLIFRNNKRMTERTFDHNRFNEILQPKINNNMKSLHANNAPCVIGYSSCELINASSVIVLLILSHKCQRTLTTLSFFNKVCTPLQISNHSRNYFVNSSLGEKTGVLLEQSLCYNSVSMTN